MAGVSAIGALSSMSEEDLFYQYMINNNSKSTMLNAVLGNDSDTSGNGLGGVVSSLYGNNGISNISSLIGGLNGGDDLNSLSTMTTFSQVLKTYMSAQVSEAAQMAESLSGSLKEAEAAGESDTVSYKTVQEIYQYFMDKTNTGKSLSDVSSQTSGASGNAASSANNIPIGEQVRPLEADTIQKELDSTLAMMQYGVI